MFYVRKWFSDQVNVIKPHCNAPNLCYGVCGGFFRALGAKIGKHTEISTASSVTHPLLEIGDGAFVADAVTLGEADIRGQQLDLGKNHDRK